MPDKKNNMKDEAATEEKPSTQPAFIVKMGLQGWPIVDQVGKVTVIERDEKDLLSLGIQDANERKEIVLTAPLEKWKKIFEDGLAYIKAKNSTN